MSAAMINQQLVNSGNWMMDETDQAIESFKKVGLSLMIILFWNKFIYFGKLEMDKFHRLFWSVIMVSSVLFMENLN